MRALGLDGLGTALSAACILHCVALPAIGIAAPVLAAAVEGEGVHKALTLVAVAVAAAAFSRPRAAGLRWLGGLGSLLLLAGAFAESLHDFETPLTVGGGLLLAAAHLLRLRRPHPVRHA